MKRQEDSLRDHWDNTKCTSVWITEVPEEENEETGSEKTFEEIIDESFPKMGKQKTHPSPGSAESHTEPKEKQPNKHINQMDKKLSSKK